jgi:predicted ArsR family transcriptional regulator
VTPSLFDPDDPRTLARATDPDTSREAARDAVASGSVARHESLILAALAGHAAGMTSEEIATAAGLDRHAAARRLPELERRGLVRRGEPRRSAGSGRRGVTWGLTPKVAA